MKERSKVKHLDRKQQEEWISEIVMKMKIPEEKMKQIRSSNGCSLDVNLSLSYRQSYSWGISLFLFFSPATQGYWTCLAPLPLLSLLLRGQSLDTRQIQKKKVNKILHYSAICPTDTSVCTRGVKAPCLHSRQGSGPSPPLPAES